MKRLLAATAVTICLGASAVFADSALTIRPSDMKDGETKTLTDDDRQITIKREGDKLRVEIDKAGKTEKLTITRDGDSVRIERPDGTRSFVYSGPGDGVRRHIIIDGQPLDLDSPRFRELPRRKMQSWFICPKDKTMLRVPEDADDKEYKCPVDGTTMEKRSGAGFGFFFDTERSGERHDL